MQSGQFFSRNGQISEVEHVSIGREAHQQVEVTAAPSTTLVVSALRTFALGDASVAAR